MGRIAWCVALLIVLSGCAYRTTVERTRLDVAGRPVEQCRTEVVVVVDYWATQGALPEPREFNTLAVVGP